MAAAAAAAAAPAAAAQQQRRRQQRPSSSSGGSSGLAAVAGCSSGVAERGWPVTEVHCTATEVHCTVIEEQCTWACPCLLEVVFVVVAGRARTASCDFGAPEAAVSYTSCFIYIVILLGSVQHVVTIIQRKDLSGQGRTEQRKPHQQSRCPTTSLIKRKHGTCQSLACSTSTAAAWKSGRQGKPLVEPAVAAAAAPQVLHVPSLAGLSLNAIGPGQLPPRADHPSPGCCCRCSTGADTAPQVLPC